MSEEPASKKTPSTAATDARTLFKRQFGYSAPHLVRAPEGWELLGTATLDPQGLAIAVAVDQYVEIASAPRTDGKIELVSVGAGERELFWISEFKRNPASPWADGMKAILEQLRRRGVLFSGFTAAVAPGSGDLSALEVAMALTVRKLYPFTLTETGATLPPKRNPKGELPPLGSREKLPIARLCQAAAQSFLGTELCLARPLASLFGKAWHVLSIDLQSLTVETVALVGEVLVVCEPQVAPGPFGNGAPHLNSGSEGPARENGGVEEMREACHSAIAKLRVRSLRALERKLLEANKDKLSEREYECARYLAGEVQRVVAAERALRADDHRQFGQFLLQSYEASRDVARNRKPGLELVVQLARKHPGCLGSRVNAGSTVSLVAFHQAEDFMGQLSAQFEKATGSKLRVTLRRSANAAP